MNERDYVWDGSGTPDPEVEALERGLAPLAEEAEAMLASIDFEALAEVEVQEEPQTADDRGVVLQLSGASVDVPVDVPDERELDRDRGSLWMAAAAAVLLTLSALSLFGARDRGTAAVAGDGDDAAASHIEVVVAQVDTELGAGREHVLEQLRPLHEDIATCLGPISEAEVLELRVALTDAGAVVEASEFDEPRRACLTERFASWDARALGAGRIDLELRLDPAELR